MDNHDELMEEAMGLAKNMKQGQKIEQAFIYAYVANHELRSVWQELKYLRWLICSAVLLMALGIVANILAK
jgi:uncharacterized membrane protein